MHSSTTLSRMYTSSTHSFAARDDTFYLPILEATLARNVLREATEMMRLITMETINSKTDAACLCLLLKDTEVNQSLINKPFDFSTENVVSIMLSIESQWRILMVEVAMTQSFPLFFEKMRKWSSLLEASKKHERSQCIVKDVQILKRDQSLNNTFSKMKFYANELHSRLESEDFKKAVKLRLTVKQCAAAIENATDLVKHKEHSHSRELHHYDIEYKKENCFRMYLESSVDLIYMFEREVEYWSKKYEDDMETIENKIHTTEESIKSLQASLVYHRKEYKKLYEYNKNNQMIAKVVKQWHEFASDRTQKRAASKIRRKKGQKKISPKKNKASKVETTKAL